MGTWGGFCVEAQQGSLVGRSRVALAGKSMSVKELDGLGGGCERKWLDMKLDGKEMARSMKSIG